MEREKRSANLNKDKHAAQEKDKHSSAAIIYWKAGKKINTAGKNMEYKWQSKMINRVDEQEKW